LGDVEIGPTVAIIVTNGDTHTIATTSDDGLFGYQGECSITVVAVESVAQRRLGIVKIAAAAVDEVDVHPAVVVVVEECATPACRLGQVVFSRSSINMFPCDATDRCGNLLE